VPKQGGGFRLGLEKVRKKGIATGVRSQKSSG
jgi:hypothetical protein